MPRASARPRISTLFMSTSNPPNGHNRPPEIGQEFLYGLEEKGLFLRTIVPMGPFARLVVVAHHAFGPAARNEADT